MEATFFALLMSLNNLGTQGSHSVGAYLYTALGQGPAAYTQLVLVSAAATAAIWLLVPLVPIERIAASDIAPGRLEWSAQGEPAALPRPGAAARLWRSQLSAARRS